MGNFLYDFFVDFVATFAAAVLNHPVMHDTVLNVVVHGVDRVMAQPDLDRHVLTAAQTLQQHQTVLAKKAGRELPKVAGSFVKGMVHLGKPPPEDILAAVDGKGGGDKGDGDSRTGSLREEASLADDRSTGSQQVAGLESTEDAPGREKPDRKHQHRWLHPMKLMRHQLQHH